MKLEDGCIVAALVGLSIRSIYIRCRSGRGLKEREGAVARSWALASGQSVSSGRENETEERRTGASEER